MTLPANIARSLDALVRCVADNERRGLWSLPSHRVSDARQEVEKAVAELAAERDAAQSKLSGLTGRLDGAMEAQRRLVDDRDEHRDRSERYGSRIDELLKERTKVEKERDAAVAKCAELERIAEQSRREGQEIAAGLHERIAELERDLADERKDIADAQLVLPACCGSLADAASTLKQERDELERELQRDLELMARTSLWRRLREQLDAVTAQRDELLRAAEPCCVPFYGGVYHDALRFTVESVRSAIRNEKVDALDRELAIARAQPEQPQQPKEEP